MHSLWHDIRFSIRTLLKRPGFSLVAIGTLALGVGVNAALFSVFNAFVLKPLPVKDPDSLVSVEGVDAQGQRRRLFSYRDYLDYRDQNKTLAHLVAWNKVRATLGDAPPAQNSDEFAEGYQYLFGQIVSGNYFEALGAGMSKGRSLNVTDDQNPDQSAAVVLSYKGWERYFGSDPLIVGKTIRLQGEPFTVVGVTAPGFIGTTPDAPSFWAPLMMRDRLIQSGGWEYKRWQTDRDSEAFTLLGRIRPGASRDEAEAELQLITARLGQNYASEGRKSRVWLESAATFVSLNEDTTPLLVPLLIGFGLVLVISGANVANLLLARAASRQREISVRLALGASRWRVIRQLLTESLLVSLAGGVAGLLLAVWTVRLLYPLILSSLPLPEDLTAGLTLNLAPDWRVFGFTLLVATGAGIVAGLAPALQASRPELTQSLKDEGSAFGRHFSQSRLRNLLVVAQVAVCMILLTAAGLLVRNLQRVKTIDTGMSLSRTFSIALGLKGDNTRQKDDAKLAELRRQLAERLSSTPGVAVVSRAQQLPLSGGIGNTLVTLPGQSINNPTEVRFNSVSAEYFAALAVPLSRGRHFTRQEVDAGSPVIVISEATARRFWPDADPLGKSIGVAAGTSQTANAQAEASSSYRQYEVIGIARDARSRWVWDKDETMFYVPLSSTASRNEYLIVRTAADPAPVMNTVRALAPSIDPSLRLSVKSLEDSLAVQMAPFRAIAWLSGVLGLLALTLASAGLYGVMSFVVTQRTRETGIRLALGAQGIDVVKLFLRHGLKLTTIGVVCGAAGAALTACMLAAVLIDLSPFDPLTFIGVAVFLTLVATLAIMVPTRRATKVDPLVALRHE